MSSYELGETPYDKGTLSLSVLNGGWGCGEDGTPRAISIGVNPDKDDGNRKSDLIILTSKQVNDLIELLEEGNRQMKEIWAEIINNPANRHCASCKNYDKDISLCVKHFTEQWVELNTRMKDIEQYSEIKARRMELSHAHKHKPEDTCKDWTDAGCGCDSYGLMECRQEEKE